MKKTAFAVVLFVAASITELEVKAQAWLLSGNAGTDPSTDFIGTTDLTKLIFRVAGEKAGLLDTLNGNTAFGYKSLPLPAPTQFSQYGNCAFGIFALHSDIGGSNNVAIGRESLYSNTSGYSNCAIGPMSMYLNINGYGNVAIGDASLHYNSSGIHNVALGRYSLLGNTTGDENTAIGFRTLTSSLTANYNTASGANALRYNSTGSSGTAIGRSALTNNSTGSYNTACGYSTGSANDANTYCTFIGFDADQSNLTDYTNSTALGRAVRITASNQVRIGSTSVTSIGGYEGWTNVSDGRFKKEIKENVHGLDFILKLRPVTYMLDVNALAEKLGEDVMDDDDGNRSVSAPDATTKNARDEKSKIIQTGFIAQEVEMAAAGVDYDFSGVDKPKNEDDLYGLRYAEFTVPLVKAVQEQNQMIEEQRKMIAAQTEKIIQLEQRLNSMERKSPQHLIEGALLEQNIPNPFHQTTTIKYSLPSNLDHAVLKIYSAQGIEIKSYSISQSGRGEIIVEANSLPAGIYSYMLIVDGKMLDAKQMLLTR